MTSYGVDSFQRSNTSNGTWGTATGGQTWAHPVGSALNFAVTSNEGVISSTPSTWDHMILGTNTITGTLDVLVRCIVPDQFSCFGVILRSDSGATHNYLVCYDAFQSPAGLMMYYDNNNTFVNVGSPSAFSVTNGSAYWIRGQITGTTLRGKIWADGSSEPSSWTVSATPGTTLSSGGFGIICNANTAVKFDHFTASDGTTATTAIKSVPLRSVVATLNHKSTPVRAKVATGNTKSTTLRARVASLMRKSLALRAMVATLTTRSVAMRVNVFVPIFTAYLSTVLRAVVATSQYKSMPFRIKARTQEILSTALRIYMPDFTRRSVALRIVTRGASPSYTVVSGGQELFIVAGSLTIDGTIGKRSTASFTVHSDTTLHFKQYQQVFIYDTTGNLAFSGYVSQPKTVQPGFYPSLNHTIQCIDQHFLADKRVVAASFSNRTCGFIATWLVNNILAEEGVSIGQIYDGPLPGPTLYPSSTLYPGGNVGVIPLATFVYSSVSQALDSLVTAASTSGVPYYWSIDANKRLWFVPYTAVVNTNIIDGSSIEYLVGEYSVTNQNPTYRNVQYIVGGTAETLPQEEIRVGDGVTQSWAMGYDLAHEPTVAVNTGSGYVTKTIGIKGVDSGKDFYWNEGDPNITQDSSGTILRGTPNNDLLKIDYIGQYPTVIISEDSGQIGYEASIDGSTGIVESVQTDSTISSVENGMSLASQLLSRYAQQGVQLTFTTRDASYSQGQLATVNLPNFDLNNVQMLISDVSASDQHDALNIYYTIQAVLGPYDVSWVDYFSAQLKQQQTQGNINAGVSQTLALVVTAKTGPEAEASFNMTVFPSLIPGPHIYPSSTLYPG